MRVAAVLVISELELKIIYRSEFYSMMCWHVDIMI
jgi:hypothetical protein